MLLSITDRRCQKNENGHHVALDLMASFLLKDGNFTVSLSRCFN